MQKSIRISAAALLLAALPMIAAPAALAQNAGEYASRISSACAGSWQSQNCLKAVSESSMALTTNYMASLDRRGKSAASETVKQHCAASTAAMTEQIPAGAMLSAYTECANTIYDVSEQTGVEPDQSLYLLLVGPVLCLSGDRRCTAVEQGLKSYR